MARCSSGKLFSYNLFSEPLSLQITFTISINFASLALALLHSLDICLTIIAHFTRVDYGWLPDDDKFLRHREWDARWPRAAILPRLSMYFSMLSSHGIKWALPWIVGHWCRMPVIAYILAINALWGMKRFHLQLPVDIKPPPFRQRNTHVYWRWRGL